MKKLITLNLISGFVLSIANFYFLYIDIVLFSCMTYFLYLIIVFVNLSIVFTKWHNYKYFSLIPFVASLLFIPFIILSDSLGNKIGMYRNPSCPEKYFNEERKKELTGIAEELLQTHDEKAIEDIKKKLSSHHLILYKIIRNSNIVEFKYRRPRIMDTYIFAKNGLSEAYSTKPVITEEDISSWAELVNIFNPQNAPLKYRRGYVVFVPEIAYPYLTKNLDKDFIDKVSAMESDDDYLLRNKINLHLDSSGKGYADYLNLIAGKLSKEEKLKVIEILNKQCRISSGLVEDSNISGTPKRKFLHIPGTGGFDTRFQVGKHFKQLVSDGVISFKDSEGHLQLKSNLNDQEMREIEWFQVEMMDHIYGNLIRKEEYWANGKTKLADNWYFYKY